MKSGTKIDRRRILVVEDDESMRMLLERALARSYDIDVAEDGVAALAQIRRRPPDLVILDVRMPRMDGFELLSRLEADGFGRPVILMSASVVDWPESPLVRERYDKLAGMEALMRLCAEVLENASPEPWD